MLRWMLLLPVVCWMTGCHSAKPVDPDNRGAVLNAWFEELDEENFALHDTLLEALFVSRRTEQEVFVVRVMFPGESGAPPRRYRVSLVRGGSDNVVGVNYATREFRLDHFLPSDGSTLDEVRQNLVNQARIRSLKQDLGIFGGR